MLTRKMEQASLPQELLIAGFGLAIRGGFSKDQCDFIRAGLMPDSNENNLGNNININNNEVEHNN